MTATPLSRLSDGEVVDAVLSQLGPGPNVRLERTDLDHIAALVESGGDWPPILVTGATGRVIDGHHRVGAARDLGWTTIPAVVVEVDDVHSVEARLLAMEANATHGRPFTLADRKHNAYALIRDTDWSDERIAKVSGISGKTVAKLRPKRAGSEFPNLRGRDGKSYPTPEQAAERREVAARELAEKPTASDREVALRSGLSPRTVADVRRRNAAGGEPAPPRLRSVPDVEAKPQVAVRDIVTLVPCDWAREEPCRRSNAAREFARFMDRFTRWRNKGFDHWRDAFGADCPAELRTEAIQMARWMAESWATYAKRLEAS